MALQPSELALRLVAALEAAGYLVAVETELADRPLLLDVSRDGTLARFRIFLWNATPGGPTGVRSADEFRVQTTRPGTVPFLEKVGPQTLLLGYHQDLDVLAAWDVRLHPNPGSSSSLQVTLGTLEEAKIAGFASWRRTVGSGEEQEVVMAFSPGNVGAYLEILPLFQAAVVEPSDARLGQSITSGEEPPVEELPVEPERRTAAHTVVRVVRDRRFRARVVRAYRGRCAFCGLGLGLVDAAHIKAVELGGPDLVSNGLCACPTHHRAFDHGLLLIGDDLAITVNRGLANKRGFSETAIARLEHDLLDRIPDPEGPAPEVTLLAEHRARWRRG